MIDLNKHKTTSTSFLNKINIKRSMKSDDVFYEMELTYMVDNLIQAQTLNSVVGGCESAFVSHVENSENKVSIKSTINNSLWHLEVLDDNDDPLFSRMVDILHMSFNTSHVGCFLNVKVKTMKADESDASILVKHLGRKMKTKFENPQQVLFNLQSDTDVSNVKVIGGVDAYTGSNVIGVKISEEKDKFIIDNFGVSHVVLKDDVSSVIEIASKGFVGFCEEYKAFTEDRSWAELLPYVVTFSSDEGEVIELNSDILQDVFS
ncbi:MAG: hypothetical protein ACR2M6_02460 [Vampirovibrionia bacterium]